MKKIVSTVLLCLLLVGAMYSLSSCGVKNLYGTYEVDNIYEKVTYDFEYSGEVTCTVSPAEGDCVVYEGHYSWNEKVIS